MGFYMKLKNFAKCLFSALVICWANHVTGVDQAFTPTISFVEGSTDAAVVWQFYDTDFRIQGATLVNGQWSGATLISGTLPNNTIAPVISRVNTNGNVVALWSYFDDTASHFLMTSAIMENFVWSTTPINVSFDEDANFGDHQIRLDDSDNMSAIWTSQNNSGQMTIRGATGTISGGWNSPITIAP